MSWILHDPDEWETVVTSESWGKFPGTNVPMGSCGISQSRRSPDEIAQIKAAKQLQAEDAILAEAERIRSRREMNAS